MAGRSGFHARAWTEFIMKRLRKQSPLLIAAAAMVVTGYFRADMAMTTSIPEEGYKMAESSVAVRSAMCEAIRIKVTPGVHHYRVWLPKGCHRDKTRRPALFIATPDGNPGMDNVARFAAEWRRIVIMLDESYSGKVNYTQKGYQYG